MVAKRKRRGREKRLESPVSQDRSLKYRQLRHPFAAQGFFSEDAIMNIHNMALKVLEELGIKVLLDEARKIYKTGGAIVNEDDLMVRIGHRSPKDSTWISLDFSDKSRPQPAV